MTTKENTTLEEILGSQISRNEALKRIQSQPEAYEKFQTFPLEYQEQVLQFIQGIRGLPILI